VFDYWARKQAGLTGAAVATIKLTEKRRRKIRARIREGYSVDDLKRAVDGMMTNPFNVEGRHTDVELACRDAEHVDRYMAGPPVVKTNGKGGQKVPEGGSVWESALGEGGGS
jgi:hypothetical protein